ncbi:MAG: hypothetical protein Q8L85_05425 [Alphaproteobacteria bacterium]|nr:hypothetical protein [Alphaproteobacteria bacterium]
MFGHRSIYILFLGIILWCGQAIAAPAHVAVLGWGSLIGNPGDLGIYGQFVSGGPTLPVAFTRISQDGRLTLVVDPKSDSNQRKPSNVDYPGMDVQTQYLLIKDNNGLNFDKVIGELRKREGTKSDYIDYVNRAARKFRINQINAFTGEQVTVEGTYSIDRNGEIDIDGGGALRRELTPYLKGIIQWVHQMDFKGAVWTGLQRNFAAKSGSSYSLANAKIYLRSLDPTQRAKALEYIQNAPVKTPHGNILLAYLNEMDGNLVPSNDNLNIQVANDNPRAYRASPEILAILNEAKRLRKIGNAAYITNVIAYGGAEAADVILIQDGAVGKVLKVFVNQSNLNDMQTDSDKAFIHRLNQMAKDRQVVIPKIIVAEDAFIVSQNVIEIQEKAKGKLMKEVIRDMGNMTDQEIKEMLTAIGEQYGALDKILTENNRSLIRHNDDKSDNLFYDKATQRISWIDIEGISKQDKAGRGINQSRDEFSSPEFWNALKNLLEGGRPRNIKPDDYNDGKFWFTDYWPSEYAENFYEDFSPAKINQLKGILSGQDWDQYTSHEASSDIQKIISLAPRVHLIADSFLNGYLKIYPENSANIERYKSKDSFYNLFQAIPQLKALLQEYERAEHNRGQRRYRGMP